MTELQHPIRILIVDDHSIIRMGLRAVLQLEDDMELVGEAENGQSAVQLAAELLPDVIVMDLEMPVMNGITAIQTIASRNLKSRILVLTNFAGEDQVMPALKAGALGYQLKDSKPDVLVEAIRQVYRGESSLHPVIARQLLMEISRPEVEEKTSDPLTPREMEILKLVARGYENDAIARKLFISEATVRTHVSHILSKLHLASRTQAALYALREGLTSLDQKPDF